MYNANLNLTKIKDNNRFWKTLKPFLTDKGVNTPKITLIANADVEVAETLNSCFSDAINSLHINENCYILNDTLDLTDPIDIALKKFESLPSILIIKDKVSASPFTFNTVTLEDVQSEIRNLNPNKASAVSSIPIRNFKENFDICGPTLYPIVNNAILDCISQININLLTFHCYRRKMIKPIKRITDP